MAKDLKGKELPKGIRQRKNGRYEGRIKYDYKSYSVYGDTITEVKKGMTELRYKLEHGLFVADSKITLEDWFHTWIQEYKVNQVKKGTYELYGKYFLFYIKNTIGSRRMTELRGEHIQRLYNDLVKKEIAVPTIKIIDSILNGCLKQAVKNGIIERNPASLATIPRETREKKPRVLTVEEQNAFMEYAKESYLYHFFALALRTGMRVGEITGLKFSDIDRTENVIRIRRTLKYAVGEGFSEDTPKTGTSKRDIPLTEDMAAIISEQRAAYKENIISFDGYVFHLPNGQPLKRARVQYEITRITKKMNQDGIQIEHFTPHCFRHTFATRAIENGMNPQTLKVIIGHSTLAMTMDLYAHVLPTTKKEEMEKISKAF